MLTIKRYFFKKNIRTLLFQEKVLANQILQIFNKTMPSHSYCVVVFCHFHRERFLAPNPLMDFFFHEKPKNIVAESCLNGIAYCASFLTWAVGGDFWGLGSFSFFSPESVVGKSRIILDFCLRRDPRSHVYR